MSTSELTNVIARLDRDLRDSVVSLSVEEAGFLVDTYYRTQDARIRAAHQAGQLNKAEKKHEVIEWLSTQDHVLENRVKTLLDRWTDSQPVGRYLKSICGVGPVIAAGLLAHIDIEKAPTAGHIWRYAGLDPTAQRKKGEKLKYNPDLKRLCFLIGESFIKQQSRENDVYGKLYLQRKAYEQEKNERGDYKDQAAAALANKKFRDDTATKAIYESGKLPPAHLHARARRWCVKLFLSQVHHFWYSTHYGKEPPLPYPIAILHHTHLIPGPDHG